MGTGSVSDSDSDNGCIASERVGDGGGNAVTSVEVGGGNAVIGVEVGGGGGNAATGAASVLAADSTGTCSVYSRIVNDMREGVPHMEDSS